MEQLRLVQPMLQSQSWSRKEPKLLAKAGAGAGMKFRMRLQLPVKINLYINCGAGAGAARSQNFWPKRSWSRNKVSDAAPAPSQNKLVYQNIINKYEQVRASKLNWYSFKRKSWKSDFSS